jgi:FkbM family methyltransferase
MTAWPRRFPTAIDPVWFCRNIATSWSRCVGVTDVARYMLWLYSRRLPRAWQRDWTIRFRYPPPVGALALRLRGNDGADGFIHSEVFEHHYYRLPLDRPPATILDLGAHIGLTAIYFGRMFPDAELVCVEPIPENLALLARNLDLNGVRATLISAAIDVSDHRVMMELHARDYDHRIATPGEGSARPTIEVAAVSVRSILRQVGWKRIGLLKVDIEGHEAVLLTGDCDWLDQVDSMCIECHDGFDEAALHRLAARYGFARPRRLPGIWFLSRAKTDASVTAA